ncbi:MAG TPA: TrkH family potassium uptake protein [Porticoccaceae bacterium]|nr:TrkH family potassium uptake protein [Porticoccaceae bacterium]
MHPTVVSRILGLFLMVFSITLLAPIVVAVIYQENTAQDYFLSFAITFSLGMMMWLPFSRSPIELRTRDGFIITVLFWVVLGLTGTLPLMLVDEVHLSFSDALFESVSGITTSGGTVISGLDHLPKSILYYRQQLHFLGGIGIVVIAVAIMPMLGIGGMQLYKAENVGPSKETKMTPRIAETAKALFIIYLFLNAVCTLAYWIAGMNFFDALTHSFSTISTGGFANYDASMGYFDNHALYAICVFFMIVSSLSFGLHYYAWVRGTVFHYWRNPEARMFLLILLAGCVIASAYLYFSRVYGWQDSLMHGIFQLVSITTSTGFITTDFSVWPSFLPFFLLVLSFFGGCVGSTTGGVKMGRMLIMTKQVMREISRLVHPSGVFSMKVRNWAVPTRVTDAVWAFFGVYLAVYYLIVLLLLASGLDYVTAWSATAASLNNMGPGLGEVAAHFGDINPFAKWVLSAAMILGRLEIFTVLVLFSPMFWRR